MDTPRFIFRGNAVGVAGHIHDPEDTILWVRGASSLPVIGGYSRSKAEAVVTKYLSAELVKTYANGDISERDKAFKTISSSVVKTLTVSRRVTADLLEATLISTHPLDGGQPRIVPTGTKIQNLRLDGFPVDVKLDVDLFTQYGTFDSLKDAYASDDAFFKRYGSRFASRSGSSTKTKMPQGKREIPVIAGHVMCSLVEEIHTEHPQARVNGNAITLPDYGTIYLGEMLITGVSRRLTLFRAKLGSPVTGEVACSEVEDNGIIVI